MNGPTCGRPIWRAYAVDFDGQRLPPRYFEDEGAAYAWVAQQRAVGPAMFEIDMHTGWQRVGVVNTKLERSTA